jgi:hypothetical protein
METIHVKIPKGKKPEKCGREGERETRRVSVLV